MSKKVIIICIIVVAAFIGITASVMTYNSIMNRDNKAVINNGNDISNTNDANNKNNTNDTNNSNETNVPDNNITNNNDNQPESEARSTPIPTAKKPLVEEKDFELNNLENEQVTLSSLRGKMVVMYFWASTNDYSREELPDYYELHKQFQNEEDIELLMVNWGGFLGETVDSAKKYLSENNMDFNVLFDTEGEVTTGKYAISAIPMTIIVDKNGYRYDYFPGKTPKEDILDAVERLRQQGGVAD